MVVPKRKDGMPRKHDPKKERKRGQPCLKKKRDRDDSREKRHHLKE